MPFAIQYSQDSGTAFLQFELTKEDLFLSDGMYPKHFGCVKDSKDNLFIILTPAEASSMVSPKIIKFSKKTETKIVSTIVIPHGQRSNNGCRYLFLSRDEKYLFAGLTSDGEYNVRIDVNFQNGGPVSFEVDVPGTYLALYQDRYIWSASGTTVSIYDYTTKSLLASKVISAVNFSEGVGDLMYPLAIACSTENKLYLIGRSDNGNNYDGACVVRFNNQGTLLAASWPIYAGLGGVITNTKQIIVDKWGDLIVMDADIFGEVSTIMKYTAAGGRCGAVGLIGLFFNLNTDKDGNYYYSDIFGTYKVPKNTTQGEPIASLNQHIKIRSNGMGTFSNNISGYNPAVFE